MRSSWQWLRFLMQMLISVGLEPLRINLDETSIVLNHDGQKGVVNKSRKRETTLVQKISKKRGTLTHVAIICDDSTIQPMLPQMIIGNNNLLRVSDMKELETELPKNVTLVRAKSSWITVELFIVLLEMLRKTLDQNKIFKIPIILMDACPVHLHALVWKAARRLRIMVCFVPATLTWLLQPLDVMVFRKFKCYVRSQYRRVQIQRVSAWVPVVEMIKIWIAGIKHILQGNAWSRVFDACGYALNPVKITSQIQAMFEKCPGIVQQTCMNQLSHEQLLDILPKKRNYAFATLLWSLQQPQTSLTRALVTAAVTTLHGFVEMERLPSNPSSVFRNKTVEADMDIFCDDPIASRTRSRSRISFPSFEPTSVAHLSDSPSREPCRLSILEARESVAVQHEPHQRLRPQALPQARRPRLL